MRLSKTLIPYAALVGVLTLGVLTLAFGVEVTMTGEAGVIMTGLPEQVGAWRGEPQMYCLGDDCGRRYKGAECQGLEACLDCGSEVNTMSRAEHKMLPKDTLLNRYSYQNPSGRTLQASVVLSGRQRSSLHRPELCLSVSGYEIDAIRKLTVDLDDGSKLHVRVLDLVGKARLPNGRIQPIGSYYAYWFAAPSHRTPNHLARMFWMAVDKVLLSRIDRWAYISVSGPRDLADSGHMEVARDFIQDFYPLIEKNDPARAAP